MILSRINEFLEIKKFSNNDNKRFCLITPRGADLRTTAAIEGNFDLERKLGGKPKKASELLDGTLVKCAEH